MFYKDTNGLCRRGVFTFVGMTILCLRPGILNLTITKTRKETVQVYPSVEYRSSTISTNQITYSTTEGTVGEGEVGH